MRIAIWAGGYQHWESVHPDNLYTSGAPQMGGSEASVLATATALVQQGNYVLLGAKTKFPQTFSFEGSSGMLRMCPDDLFSHVAYVEPFDVLVAWDDVGLFRYAYEHIPVKVVCFQLNDIPMGLGVFSHIIDLYFHPSKWHAHRFAELYDIPTDKQRSCITNGLIAPTPKDIPEREQRVIWISSPDRGLHHLLKIWPLVAEKVPDAHLDIYYDMERWLYIVEQNLAIGRHLITTDRAIEVRNRLAPLLGTSVTYHGGCSRWEVQRALAKSKVMVYPCDPVAPTEGFSMSVLEAWAAGCKVIISDADALGELWSGKTGITVLPLPFQEDIWTDRLIRALGAKVQPGPREVPQKFKYQTIASRWLREITKVRR